MRPRGVHDRLLVWCGWRVVSARPDREGVEVVGEDRPARPRSEAEPYQHLTELARQRGEIVHGAEAGLEQRVPLRGEARVVP